MLNRLRKKCLITGAAGGIGRILVNVFHEADYQVIATDIKPQPAELSCAKYLQADLARFTKDESYAQNILTQVENALDDCKLNVLINNAAVQILGGADSLTRKDWYQTLDVNLLAPFLITQAFLPSLERAKGCVINIGSIHARLTKKNFVAYASSKAALAGLTRSLAVDIGGRLRINAIEPAAIKTDMLMESFLCKNESYEQLACCHPQNRIGQPKEVAQLALAIADGEMRFLHGACIGIDGGISSRLFDPD